MVVEKTVIKLSGELDEILVFDIAPTSLRNPIFITKIKELLEYYPQARNKIMFMLFENEYFSNIDKYNSILKSLKNLGAFIGIDRLGASHTSFLYLRDLEIDVVRFDSFYTKEINDNKNIIRGLNLSAHDKNIKTWVKLIEEENDLEVAKNMNVDYLQGKYLAQLELTKD
jgi:EAL domain-containing protein (putative c-di-GMP-specific phosphodiesterase class I)